MGTIKPFEEYLQDFGDIKQHVMAMAYKFFVDNLATILKSQGKSLPDGLYDEFIDQPLPQSVSHPLAKDGKLTWYPNRKVTALINYTEQFVPGAGVELGVVWADGLLPAFEEEFQKPLGERYRIGEWSHKDQGNQNVILDEWTAWKCMSLVRVLYQIHHYDPESPAAIDKKFRGGNIGHLEYSKIPGEPVVELDFEGAYNQAIGLILGIGKGFLGIVKPEGKYISDIQLHTLSKERNRGIYRISWKEESED